MKLINQKKNVLSLEVKKEKEDEKWRLDFSIKEAIEKDIIEANVMFKKLQDLIWEHHDEKIRLLLKKPKFYCSGSYYLENLEPYLIPITENTTKKWEKEIYVKMNEVFRFTRRKEEKRLPNRWQIIILSGERGDKMLQLLVEKLGYLKKHPSNYEYMYKFNDDLNYEMASSAKARDEIIDFLRSKGIVAIIY